MSGNRLAVAYLDVPLSHPSSPQAIRTAEKYGFFWGALMPAGRPDGDVLRLQRIGPVDVDTTDVEYATDHGRGICEFVLSERERVEELARGV